MTDVTVTVTNRVAEALIELSGAERDLVGRWVFPDEFATWATDEALLHALPFVADHFEAIA